MSFLKLLPVPLLVGSLCAMSGCNVFSEGRDCTLSVEPAVVVRIIEAGSGKALAAGATGIVRDGAFWDHLQPHAFVQQDSLVMISRRGADEREGIYQVEVSHPGYAPITLAGVRAEAGVCHVNTQTVTVELVPLPQATAEPESP
jgi:hypothetical protein